MKAGSVVATYDVDKTHDTAYFKADSGSYTLKWKYKANIPEKDLKFVNLIEEKNDSVIDVQIDKYYEKFENELSSAAQTASETAKSSSHEEILSLIAIENVMKANAARTIAMHAYNLIKTDEPEDTAKAEKAEKKAEKKKAKKEAEHSESAEKSEENA